MHEEVWLRESLFLANVFLPEISSTNSSWRVLWKASILSGSVLTIEASDNSFSLDAQGLNNSEKVSVNRKAG